MTHPLAAQLSFEGRLVSAARFAIKQMVLEELPNGLTWEDAADLAPGDYIEATVRIRVLPSSGIEKVDLDSGAGTGPLTKQINLQPLRQGFRVTAVLKAEDLETAWQEAHTVTV